MRVLGGLEGGDRVGGLGRRLALGGIEQGLGFGEVPGGARDRCRGPSRSTSRRSLCGRLCGRDVRLGVGDLGAQLGARIFQGRSHLLPAIEKLVGLRHCSAKWPRLSASSALPFTAAQADGA